MKAAPALVLYGRSWCHLCEDMAAALEPLRGEHDFTLQVIDVDTDPQLESRFGERVPVLVHGELELCHYRLDTAAVTDYLLKIR